LRIAILSDHFLPTITGAGIHTCQLALGMAQRGHHVVVITTRCSGQAPVEEWNGIRIYRTRSIPVNEYHAAIPSLANLESILKQENIQIIHHQSIGVLAFQGSRAARSLGIKQVYTHHVMVEFLTQAIWFLRPFQRLIKNIATRFFNQCDAITFPARKLQADAQKQGIRVPTFYISNVTGIEATHTSSAPPRKEPSSSFIVLFVGRLHPDKNASCLLQAFAHFRASANTGELWLIGEGYQKNQLMKEATSLSLTPYVTFMGWLNRDELGRRYAQADVLAMPSLCETQGMVAIEAMYYALPLVVSRDVVSALDLVDDGENGYLVDSQSPEDIAEKLLKLHTDRTRRATMGSRSRERFEQFRDETIFFELEKLYFKVAGERP
jgi:1,2-diacylglycerol 3-alpha-glucosyltransferase